jgi:mono/diheme cytochrome c family protein
MRRSLSLLTAGGTALAAVLVIGCGGTKDKPATAGAGSGSGSGTQTAGAGSDAKDKPPGVVAFESANCNNCHATAGSAKTGRGMGPDLTKVGAKRDKEWIVAHVRDPKSHNPMSRMPASGPDKLSDKDAGVLGEYLAGLK